MISNIEGRIKRQKKRLEINNKEIKILNKKINELERESIQILNIIKKLEVETMNNENDLIDRLNEIREEIRQYGYELVPIEENK